VISLVTDFSEETAPPATRARADDAARRRGDLTLEVSEGDGEAPSTAVSPFSNYLRKRRKTRRRSARRP